MKQYATLKVTENKYELYDDIGQVFKVISKPETYYMIGNIVRSQFISRGVDKHENFINEINDLINIIQGRDNYVEIQYSTTYAGDNIMLSALVLEREYIK